MEGIDRENIKHITYFSKNEAMNMEVNEEIEEEDGEEKIIGVIKKSKNINSQAIATITQQKNIRLDIPSKNIVNTRKTPNMGQVH